MLSFLEKLTLAPGDVGQDDLTPLHAAGVSDAAIEDAIYVCAFFNIIDRVADSLDFRHHIDCCVTMYNEKALNPVQT